MVYSAPLPGFVTRAPASAKEAEGPVRVAPLTPKLASWWDQEVQPSIDDEKPTRADQGWRWPRLVGLATRLSRWLNQRPVGYAIGVPLQERNQFVPCVLLLLVGNYRHLQNHYEDAVFLWYLSAAPVAVLQKFLPDEFRPKPLGVLGLDTALVHSFTLRLMGRLGLHADRKGGEDLARWYLKQGMTNLPAGAPLPTGFRASFVPNDGRYFYYDPGSATEAITRMDRFR